MYKGAVCTDSYGMLGIWNRRNNWVWEKVNGSAFGVKDAAMTLLQEWRETQVSTDYCNNHGAVGDRVWTKPLVGWVKMNVDAAVYQCNSIGVGWVLRDVHGKFLGARCKRMKGAWRPHEADAISLKEAMSWVKEMQITHCVSVTDSKNFAAACNGKPGEAFFGTIVSDCIQLLKHIDHVLVEFAYRSANSVAPVLTKAAYSISDIGEWFVTPPYFIHHVFHIDNV